MTNATDIVKLLFIYPSLHNYTAKIFSLNFYYSFLNLKWLLLKQHLFKTKLKVKKKKKIKRFDILNRAVLKC